MKKIMLGVATLSLSVLSHSPISSAEGQTEQDVSLQKKLLNSIDCDAKKDIRESRQKLTATSLDGRQRNISGTTPELEGTNVDDDEIIFLSMKKKSPDGTERVITKQMTAQEYAQSVKERTLGDWRPRGTGTR